MVQVCGKQVHLRPAAKLKQLVNHLHTEMPLCGVRAIVQHVVCQLVVDTWSVDHPDLECPLIQSARLEASLLRVFETTPRCLSMYDAMAMLSDSINIV